jgi:hypothetical protein
LKKGSKQQEQTIMITTVGSCWELDMDDYSQMKEEEDLLPYHET